MESPAVTLGTLGGGDGVRSAITTCTSSTVTCIYLNNVGISDMWEHQKKDFLEGHGDIPDEVFVFHLLKIHANFCGEPSRMCSSSGCDVETEHSITKMSPILKREPNFTETMSAPSNIDMSLDSGQISSNSCPRSRSDCNVVPGPSLFLESESYLRVSMSTLKKSYGMGESKHESCAIQEVSEDARNIKLTELKMEAPDELSHDQATCKWDCVGLGIKQEKIDSERGPSEVESHLDAPPEGSLNVEIDLLQEVVMESPEVSHDLKRDLGAIEPSDMSHDQQREYVALEPPDVSCDQQRELVTVRIKTEDETINEGGDEYLDREINFLLDSKPSLSSREIKSTFPKLKKAKLVLQKLYLRKKLAKCEDCHNVLQGSRFHYSVDGTEQNNARKCDKCKTDGTQASELLNHAMMVAGADIPMEATNHPSLHGTSRTSRDGKSKDSENADCWDSGKKNTSPTLGVPEKQALQENETGNADLEMGATDASCGKYNASTSLGEASTRQAPLEGIKGTCRKRVPSKKQSNEILKDRDDAKGTGCHQDCDGPCKCSFGSTTISDKCGTQTHENECSCKQFICKVCSKAFFHKSNLQRHTRTHTGERPFSCKICLKSFFQGFHLTTHMRTHTGERPFSCKVCSKAFSRKCVLGLHMRIHTGERPFSCKLCAKAFSRKRDLEQHMVTHTGERPFSCKICSKAFSQKSALSKHIKTHTGERPHSCKICSKAFSQKNNLSKHLVTHTGERPFRCKICSKVFSRKDTLVIHMRTHTGEQPFSCKTCSKAFSRKSNLSKHMRTHTGE